MTLRKTLFVVLLAFAAAALVASAVPAYAEGPEVVDHLGKLTDAERERLERSAKWDELSDQRKQRIAAAVIKMRDMTPEQRRQVEERVKRYNEARKRGDAKERLGTFREKDARERDFHRAIYKLARGAAQTGISRLSEEKKKALREWRVHRGLEMAFYRLFVEAAVTPYVRGDKAFDLEMVPEKDRDRVKRMLEKYGQDERKRGRIAHMVFNTIAMDVAGSVAKPLVTVPEGQSPTGPDRPRHAAMQQYYVSLGEALEARFPEAFAAAVSRVESLSSADEARELVKTYGKPADGWSRGDRRKQRAGHYVGMLLEAPAIATNAQEVAEIQSVTKPFLRLLLIRQFGIPEGEVDAALDHTDPQQRKRAVLQLAKEHKIRVMGMGGGWKASAGQNGANKGRRPGGPGGRRR